MAKSKRVTVIGAGAVGVNAALMLDKLKLGYEVTLIERTGDILTGGAASTTNILHFDGFEYHKPGHSQTGYYCIDGAITKAMMYPSNVYLTNTCTPERPIRFFVSKDSEGVDGLTVENFTKNAEDMRRHFTHRFDHFSEKRGRAQTEKMLGRNPQTFAHPLSKSEYSDCENIVCGYAGSGGSINMPHYYAFLKAALRSSDIDLKFDQFISRIEKKPNDTYEITSVNNNDGATKNIVADGIIIAASHHATQLTARISGVELLEKDGITCAAGTYYLNVMNYVILPATSDKKKLDAVSRLNFILQGEGGCMFACVVPPTKDDNGYGAIYYPSEKGSQFKKHLYSPEHPTPPPFMEWDEYIQNGLPNENKHVQATMEQAYRYYPFLKDYAKIDKAICRPVFNADVPDSNFGLERRVRGLIGPNIITADERVSAYWAPKWTNTELEGLIAVDQTLKSFGDKELPKSKKHGFGPTDLDVEQITRKLHFRNIKMDVKDAYNLAKMRDIPTRLIDPTIPEFLPNQAKHGVIIGRGKSGRSPT